MMIRESLGLVRLVPVVVAAQLLGGCSGGSGGTGGGAATGGDHGASGGNATGGRANTGGASATGGASGGSATGGAPATGGGAGGKPNTGGVPATGGGAGGGKPGTGGAPATGGQGGGSPPLTCAPASTGSSYMTDASGVTFTVGTGVMKVQVCKDDIIRIAYTTAKSLPAKTSLSVSNTWDKPTTFCVSEAAGAVVITTARLKVKVNPTSGVVTYTDLADNVIMAEDSKTMTAATVEGVATNKIQTVFNSPASEALFGMGQHQDSAMNLKGKTQHILNANTNIQVPLMVSNKGYGVFWDNYSTSDFYGGDSSNTKVRYVSEAGDLVDYYFFYGPKIDQVIAGYRTATGTAPLFPKWAYGLFQSKDHYASTSDLVGVKNGYRNANIPVDAIVQDWDYWDPYAWGSHFMDESRYPDPAAAVTQLHTANIHTMISVWPLYQQVSPEKKTGEMANYNALNAINALLPSGGSHHFYDTFNPMARTLVFQQINDRLLANYGWDGIWADNTEPQAYPDSVNVHAATTAAGKGALVINAYPLEHNRALYEGWRKSGPAKKRVYILTRSAFAGQQRFSAACWSGDINCDFATYTRQLPAGLNYALAGMPYWTTDIGGYFGGSTNWSSAANNELFTRWFQFGAFCSQFRIHGQGARELYNNVWSTETKANLLAIDKLRYRLMPYIYSLGWMVTNEGYTIMRHLVFDYQDDTNVYGIPDQFMFGPALLVNPVTTAGATSRSVYFPAGTWYDFWSGAPVTGGSKMTVPAPLSQTSLYVRAGSILPMGPHIQYATQSVDPLEIRVYPGKDATFTLYEDEGDTYNYESGQHAEIPFTWNDATKTLTVGARVGSFTGMLTSRTFNVVFVSGTHGSGLEPTMTPDQVIKYDGTMATATAK